MTQKVLKIGSSVGVTIPKESLKELGLKVGDPITVIVDKKRKTMAIQHAAILSSDEERIIKHGKDFIERYRKDLETLANA